MYIIFTSDIPVYTTLQMRLLSIFIIVLKILKQCQMYNKLQRLCIRLWKGMHVEKLVLILTVLFSFLRGNFQVQWYHHSNSHGSIFKLLYDMAESMLTKFVITTRVAKNSIFPRILWSM